MDGAISALGLDPMVFGLVAFVTAILLLLLFYYAWLRRFRKRFFEMGDPRPATMTTAVVLDELECSIGGKLPKSMREIYLDGRITRISLPATFQWESFGQSREDVIIMFIAADAQANRRLADYYCFSENVFIFAQDDFGNFYFVEADKNAVFFWDHDGGDISELFDSMEKFWKLCGAA